MLRLHKYLAQQKRAVQIGGAAVSCCKRKAAAAAAAAVRSRPHAQGPAGWFCAPIPCTRTGEDLESCYSSFPTNRTLPIEDQLQRVRFTAPFCRALCQVVIYADVGPSDYSTETLPNATAPAVCMDRNGRSKHDYKVLRRCVTCAITCAFRTTDPNSGYVSITLRPITADRKDFALRFGR
jgi:hypothetical protein